MNAKIIEVLTNASPNQTVAVLFPNYKVAAKVYKKIEQRLRESLIEAELSEKVNLARRHIRHFADVANAKGLEFDLVILVNVNNYDLDKVSDINRLYVGVTRACQSLVLLSSRKTKIPALVKVFDHYQQLIG